MRCQYQLSGWLRQKKLHFWIAELITEWIGGQKIQDSICCTVTEKSILHTNVLVWSKLGKPGVYHEYQFYWVHDHISMFRKLQTHRTTDSSTKMNSYVFTGHAVALSNCPFPRAFLQSLGVFVRLCLYAVACAYLRACVCVPAFEW